jgi:hypothetical protein
MKAEQTKTAELLFEFFSFISALAAFAFKAFAVMLYWKWFISEITTLRLINYSESIGLVFFLTLISPAPINEAKDTNKLIINTFVKVTITIVVGLVLNLCK